MGYLSEMRITGLLIDMEGCCSKLCMGEHVPMDTQPLVEGVRVSYVCHTERTSQGGLVGTLRGVLLPRRLFWSRLLCR